MGYISDAFNGIIVLAAVNDVTAAKLVPQSVSFALFAAVTTAMLWKLRMLISSRVDCIYSVITVASLAVFCLPARHVLVT